MNIQDINKNIQLVFRFVSVCLAVVLGCTTAQAQKQADVRTTRSRCLPVPCSILLWAGLSSR